MASMNVEKVLHMSSGAGDLSYNTNSKLQGKAIQKIKPMLQDAIGDVYKNLLLTNKMVVADLGCGPGPNTLLMASEVIKFLSKQCQSPGQETPEIQFFLNDLPGNDFNNLFKLLGYFKARLVDDKVAAVPHFIAGLPGSFYERLLPRQSVHLFLSSYSLMWISQVPKELDNNSTNVFHNKENIYIGETSHPIVVKLYQEQFQRDFSLFLKLRFDELVPNGRIVLAFLARKNPDILRGELSINWELVAKALRSMVLEELIEKEKLNSFNLPFYAPSVEEVEEIINTQGLFDIIQIQTFCFNLDPYDDDSDDDIVTDNIRSGENYARTIRAVLEPMIVNHFGETIVDDLFSRFASNVAIHLLKEKAKLPVLALSLKKKIGSCVINCGNTGFC